MSDSINSREENLDKLHKSICRPPMLNEVLKWHSENDRNKYSHFEVLDGRGVFVIYDSEETHTIDWNLDYVFLTNQSDELIEWLSELM